MKNKVLAMLLVSLIAGINGDDDSGQLAVAFAQTGVQLYAANQQYEHFLPSEKNFRRHIYWLDTHNPRYYMLDKFPFDYAIAIISDHKEKLEGKIARKENGLKSAGLRVGAMVSILSGMCAGGSYICYQASKKITSNSAVLKEIYSQNQKFNSVSFGVFSAIFAAAGVTQLYKTYHYAQRLVDRLERDKRILAILEREKAARMSRILDNYVTEETITKCMDVVAGAIGSAFKA
jgi:hypothetical protein